MNREKIERVAMACFIEGIPLASLALAPHHVAQGETCIAEAQGESDTDTYYLCLEALSREEES